jgi:hypothetical protein
MEALARGKGGLSSTRLRFFCVGWGCATPGVRSSAHRRDVLLGVTKRLFQDLTNRFWPTRNFGLGAPPVLDQDSLLRRAAPGASPLVFAHACKMRAWGDRVAGRSPHWIKSENPACAAVKRKAEEDWRR